MRESVLRGELTRILAKVPANAGYVTVTRKMLSNLLEVLRLATPSAPALLARMALHLTKKEFLLLAALMERQGFYVSTGALMAAASLASRQSLSVHLFRLRAKLEEHAPDLKIHSIHRHGYCLVVRTPNDV